MTHHHIVEPTYQLGTQSHIVEPTKHWWHIYALIYEQTGDTPMHYFTNQLMTHTHIVDPTYQLGIHSHTVEPNTHWWHTGALVYQPTGDTPLYSLGYLPTGDILTYSLTHLTPVTNCIYTLSQNNRHKFKRLYLLQRLSDCFNILQPWKRNVWKCAGQISSDLVVPRARYGDLNWRDKNGACRRYKHLNLWRLFWDRV